MKLTWQILDLRLAHPWAVARTRPAEVEQVVVVQLASREGVTGLGEASPIRRYGESVGTVGAFLQKLDPERLSFTDLESSLAYLATVSQGDKAAKCALDLALLDGAGRMAGKPVYELLEIGFEEERHVSSFTIGIDRPEVIARKALLAADYPVLKLKMGVAADAANLAALRDAAPAKLVRVDANEAWKTPEEALQHIEWLAQDRHIQFVEQPMPASTPVKDWIWLKERSPLPIFGDESCHGVEDLGAAVDSFHGINLKLSKTGGIFRAVRALKMARAAGLKTMLGCMIETSVLISAAAQLAGLADYLDLDGNLLITNDPYHGVSNQRGVLGFAGALERFGLRVQPRV